MAKKAPRQTAQRILETALALFNRYGEPQVSTTLIAAEQGISPGNLYYHYPAKDALVNALFERYATSLDELLPAAAQVRHVEDAWFLLHSLFELSWQYRFLYRDLNHLLSRNRHLETRIRELVAHEVAAARTLLIGLQRAGNATSTELDVMTTANCLVVVLTYWLSFEYVRDPRHALEPDHGQAAALQGARHALGLLAPFLTPAQQTHLRTLQDAYTMIDPYPRENPMSDLKTRFETAVANSKNLSERPDNPTLLKIYALYKQATAGDVEGERPGFSDFVGRAKWDAWNALKGQSADEAMQAYIDLIESLS